MAASLRHFKLRRGQGNFGAAAINWMVENPLPLFARHYFTLSGDAALTEKGTDAMDTSDLADLAATRYASAALEDRCAPRIKIRIPCLLRPSGNTGFAVVVTDLSIAGFQCEALTGMAPGTRCWLALPGLSPIEAQLVWNNGRAVGCSFAHMLNQAVLDSILRRFALS